MVTTGEKYSVVKEGPAVDSTNEEWMIVLDSVIESIGSGPNNMQEFRLVSGALRRGIIKRIAASGQVIRFNEDFWIGELKPA